VLFVAVFSLSATLLAGSVRWFPPPISCWLTASHVPPFLPAFSSSASCKVLEVGGRYPGLYTVAGTYNGRGDYYSEAQEYNIFFEPTSAAQAGSDAGDDDDDSDDDDKRRRRMLSGKAVNRGRKEEDEREAAPLPAPVRFPFDSRLLMSIPWRFSFFVAPLRPIRSAC